jgi:hypothetical protein
MLQPCPARFRRRSVRATASCLLAALVLAGNVSPAVAEVGWRNAGVGAMPPMSANDAAQAIRTLAVQGGKQHVLVGFSGPVGTDVREAMRAAGVRLLAYVGDNTFFAVINEPQLKDGRLAAVAGLRSAVAIDRGVKLHPMFHAGTVPPWAVVGHVSLTPGAPEPVVGAYVVFHGDVDLVGGSLLAMTYGAIVRDELESINGLVIEIPVSQIGAFADDDAVQWIEPPLPPMSDVNDSNRVVTEADNVQAPPFNLDGTGVTALIYDGGTARATHNDFSGRLTVHDGSGLSDHATHTSGTVGGDGSSSAGQFRGMAPGVDLLSFGFQWDGQGTFLYTNPGDIESDYSQAISTLGADVANNSIGSNIESNGFDCNWQGDYGVTAALIDTIVRGDGSNPLFDEPFRVVWSNGNERQGSTCDIEGWRAELQRRLDDDLLQLGPHGRRPDQARRVGARLPVERRRRRHFHEQQR